MKEIIHTIDNWSIIKLLGGLALILTAIIYFISHYFQKRLEKAIDYKYDRKLENLKGGIEKSNSTLSSAFQHFFSASQKTLDKKIHAYEELWSSLIKIKFYLPPGINLIYQILTDDELNNKNAFRDLHEKGTLGTLISSYNHDEEMEKYSAEDPLMKVQPYISDKTYKLFFVYRALNGRVTHKFLWDFHSHKIYNWKNDKSLTELLKIVLSQKELDYIYSIRVSSYPNLLDLLEYKMIQDFRKNLDIKDSTNDSIEYLKDIEKILEAGRTTYANN